MPSLFEACHEEPYRQGGHGFASWPKTKYSWAGELEELPGITVLKIHAGKSLFLTRETLAIVDPIRRAELTRLDGGDRETRRLLGHLASGGPSTLGTLQEELGLRPRELKGIRYPLERCGAIVSRQVVLPADEQPGHLHSSELARYDQIVPEPLSDQDIPRALEEIIIASVRAAVIAQERELRRWFSWKWYFPPDLVERLVDTHRLSRVGADRDRAWPPGAVELRSTQSLPVRMRAPGPCGKAPVDAHNVRPGPEPTEKEKVANGQA